MRETIKVARKLFVYMGQSDQVARASAKKLAPVLSEAISHQSRGEKKQFLRTLESLASDREVSDETYSQILRGLRADDSVESLQKAAQLYDAITLPLASRRAVNSATRQISETVLPSMQRSLTEAISFTPEQISNIATRAIHEARIQGIKDTGTALFRLAAYPVNRVRAAFVPKHLRALYEGTANIPKGRFANEFYTRLLEMKGLSGRAPASIEVTDKAAALFHGVEGGFGQLNNKIVFTKELPSLSRSDQAKMITHELKHFEQTDAVIRTFGIDRYISAIRTQTMKSLSLKYPNKTQAQISKMVDDAFVRDNVEQQIRQGFAHCLNAPKIDPKSIEGQKAMKYLDAYESYVAPQSKDQFGIIVDMPDEYLTNALEKEAYKAGGKAGSYMSIFENLSFNNFS